MKTGYFYYKTPCGAGRESAPYIIYSYLTEQNNYESRIDLHFVKKRRNEQHCRVCKEDGFICRIAYFVVAVALRTRCSSRDIPSRERILCIVVRTHAYDEKSRYGVIRFGKCRKPMVRIPYGIDAYARDKALTERIFSEDIVKLTCGGVDIFSAVEKDIRNDKHHCAVKDVYIGEVVILRGRLCGFKAVVLGKTDDIVGFDSELEAYMTIHFEVFHFICCDISKCAEAARAEAGKFRCADVFIKLMYLSAERFFARERIKLAHCPKERIHKASRFDIAAR